MIVINAIKRINEMEGRTTKEILEELLLAYKSGFADGYKRYSPHYHRIDGSDDDEVKRILSSNGDL